MIARVKERESRGQSGMRNEVMTNGKERMIVISTRGKETRKQESEWVLSFLFYLVLILKGTT